MRAKAGAAAECAVGKIGIGRIQRVVGHHAGQGLAAVKGGGRAAQDFHVVDDAQFHQVSPGRGELADGETVGQRNAVDLDADPIALQAADVEALVAEAVAVLGDFDIGHVTHHFVDALHRALLHGLAVDGGDRADDLFDRLRPALADHHHGLQQIRFGRCRRLGGECLLAQGQGDGIAQHLLHWARVRFFDSAKW